MPWKNSKGKKFLFGAPYLYEKKMCGGKPNQHNAKCTHCLKEKKPGECVLRKDGWYCFDCEKDHYGWVASYVDGT